MIDIIEKDGQIIFTARIVPGASKNQITGELDGALKIRIAAPPVDGAANAELVKFLAKLLGVPKSQITIIGGQTSKTKRVKIGGIEEKPFREKVFPH